MFGFDAQGADRVLDGQGRSFFGPERGQVALLGRKAQALEQKQAQQGQDADRHEDHGDVCHEQSPSQGDILYMQHKQYPFSYIFSHSIYCHYILCRHNLPETGWGNDKRDLL